VRGDVEEHDHLPHAREGLRSDRRSADGAMRGKRILTIAMRSTPKRGPILPGFALFLFVFVIVLSACGNKNKNKDAGGVPPNDTGVLPSAGTQWPVDVGNAATGKELVATFQCNRCHDGTGHEAAPQNKHCVHCHKDIMEDRFKAPAASITRWKPRVKEYADAPSLEAIGKRVSRSWIESYLQRPFDVRPNLHQYMPSLPITLKQAKDIAAYLVPDHIGVGSTYQAKEDLGKGRQVLETKGCGSCHTMTGVAAIPASNPPAMDPREFDRAHKLAPDLRYARDRVGDLEGLRAFLRDPKAAKPDSPMPKIALTDAEIADVLGYILHVDLAEQPAPKKVERLAVLERKVTFREVDEKVFHRTCWHCHSEPDYAIGDGGPGNSGGLGFKPRGLNLSDYNGIAAGYVDDKGERSSVFAKEKDGTPRLVRAMMARHEEVNALNGAGYGEVRGMPLGYDPLPLEEIQLVETWIAQGRPR
jgi:cytochrome c5